MASLRPYLICVLTLVAVEVFGAQANDYDDDAVPCKAAYLNKYVELMEGEKVFLNVNFTHDVNVATPFCQSGYYQGNAETMPSLTCQYALGQGYASGPDVMSYLSELKDRCVEDDGSDHYILTFGYSKNLPIEQVYVTESDITVTAMDGYYTSGAAAGDYSPAVAMVSHSEALAILRADYTFYLNVKDYSIREGPSTTQDTFHSAVILADGTGLVCGGYKSDGTHDTACQMLRDDAWTSTTYQYTTGRSLAIMSAFSDGTVIATGGATTTKLLPVTTVVALHPDGSNTDLAVMNVDRYLHAQTKINDNELIVCGGYSYAASIGYSSTCEVYNRENNAWTVSFPLNYGRYALQILNFNGDLFVLGGGTQTSANGLTVERLEEGGKKWEVQKSTLKHRRFATAGVVV